MSPFDFSTPPSKKRRITTTYGSSSVLSRALRAVKDAVPGKLISLGNEDPQEPTVSGDESSKNANASALPESVNGFADTGYNEELLDGVTAASDNGANDTSHRDGRLLHHEGHDRTFKRLRDTSGPLNNTPLRSKRRKYQTGAEAEGLDELQASEEHVHPLTFRSSPSTKAAPYTGEQQEASEPDDAVNDAHNPRVDGERPNGRSRRRPSRYSLGMAHDSSARSTPQKPKTANTPSSARGRKRGRPPKNASATPVLLHVEENELGFRKIPTKERSPTRRQDRALQVNGIATNGQPNDRKVESVERRQPLRSGTPEPEITGSTAQALDLDDYETLELEKDVEVPGVLQDCFNKLQRLLQLSSSDSVNHFKAELLRGLTGRRSPLVTMDDEYRKVQQLVTQTVLAGEGNSMLVIGPRGCGKTALVETVLSDLAVEHRDDFIAVRLNGFIHTDDKLALREIWRQLGHEVAAEEDTGGVRTNYADTLTSLLALLAHSPEDEGTMDEIARSVVFVIDEFDLFASHPRQTLLYNLFDVAQSRNAPIAVLGLTTRTDIVESLEKRVKSRFGQRYVSLAHPRTFTSYQDICKSALTGHTTPSSVFRDLGSEKSQMTKLRVAWNDHIEALFAYDTRWERFLRRLFALSKSVPSFLSSCYLPISLLSSTSIPTAASFMEQCLLPSDSKLQLLTSLSDLELSLLIAAARLEIILDTDVCNFSMVYEEYVQLASRFKVQSSAAGQTAVGGGARVWGKEVALGAWEKLMELDLVLPISTGVGGGGGRGVCRVDVALEEMEASCRKMSSTMSKWCREL
ncbi:MAG: hypothetical protein LQ338_007204 [Usnochroma carphineum]|nr:MAG: hypothetical protein LQ338_007204 [Usnochroma carphineum]